MLMEKDVVGGIFDRYGRVLLVQYANKPGFSRHIAGKWGIPSGRVDAGEKPEHAMVREVNEELGLKLRRLKLEHQAIARYAIDGKKRKAILYKCEKPAGRIRLAPDYVNYRWVDVRSLGKFNFIDPNIKHWIEKLYRE